jgi:hypothetical protein
MGLFDKHKMLFAFFMGIRIFEEGKDSAGTLNAQNLNALNRLEEMHNKTSNLMGTGRGSSGSKSKHLSTPNDPTVRKSVMSHSRRSGSIADNAPNLKDVE